MPVGAACTIDSNCKPAAGGRCIKSTADDPLFGGGPANGYCSKDCVDDSDCPGATSLCLTTQGAPTGSCFEGCTFGDPPLTSLSDPLDPAKCHGREDVRCVELMAGPACIPTCGSDSDCPGGRGCDAQLGVCVDVKTMGLPLGSACNPNADPSECAGVCIGFTGGEAMCSQACAMGGDFPSSECGGMDKGICLFGVQGVGVGDQGFCAQACTQHDQCQGGVLWCRDINVPSNGYCVGADSCVSQADCTDVSSTCTDTIFGKFCIDLTYPLGVYAP